MQNRTSSAFDGKAQKHFDDICRQYKDLHQRSDTASPELMSNSSVERDTLLERQVKVLEAISSATDGLYLNEISDLLALPRPTVYRLVNMLVEVGLVVPRGSSRKAFIIGPRLGRLLQMNFAENTLSRMVSPILDDLVKSFDETSYACRLVGGKVYAINWRVPEHDDRRGHYYPGHRMAPHAAASAKAILAYQKADIIEEALSVELEKFTDFTKTDRNAILRDYAEIRAKGYAVCDEELNHGMLAYACPVFTRGADEVFYSVAMTASSNRLQGKSVDDIVARLSEAASKFARRLNSGNYR